MKSLASDNYAGVLPEIMKALMEANTAHAVSYGDDHYTTAAKKIFANEFGDIADVRFVFNGTGANVLSTSAATSGFHSILCADVSHMYVDESTAPETFTGCRLLPVKTNEFGKVTPEAVINKLIRKGDEHHPQPKILSITQSTEYGTLYTLEEIKSLSDLIKKNDMYLHMDGARLFNAAAALNCSLKEMTTDLGVDIVSVGGTKIGMLFGEAVVIINSSLTENIKFKHKRSMQLSSKNRFIACQFEALLKDELWRDYAKHANAMANELEKGLKKIDHITITKPVQANAIFAILPETWIKPLQKEKPFYVWDEKTNEVRLMCAFDTRIDEIESFIRTANNLK